jgi:hypothetical protein
MLLLERVTNKDRRKELTGLERRPDRGERDRRAIIIISVIIVIIIMTYSHMSSTVGNRGNGKSNIH